MGADEKLYLLLAGDRDIPWAYAAEEFLKVKVASGGLYPDDAIEVCKIITAAALSDEEHEKAVHQGTLSGVRGLVSGDINLVGRGERVRGSRIGKGVGTLAGMGTGMALASKSTRGGKALASLVGAMGGRTIGDLIGSEVDVAKAKSRLQGKKKHGEFKDAEIEKGAEETKKKGITPLKAALVGAPLGAAAGLAVGLTSKRRNVAQTLRRVAALKDLLKSKGMEALNPKQRTEIALAAESGVKDYAEKLFKAQHGGTASRTIGTATIGTAAGAAAPAAAVHGSRMMKERKEGVERVRIGPQEREELSKKHGPEVLKTLKLKHASAIDRVRGILTKMAQNPTGEAVVPSPTVPLPAESPLSATPQAPELHPAIQAQLDQMQQTNEAEFYRQEAEQAKQEAETGKQRVEELIQQINMLNQNSQAQMQQDQQIRQVAEQNAQMAQQDSMMARNESLAAQQQNLALRNAVTQFRQALMNLVAQDPTQAMGPPPVQTGPMPPAPGAEQGAPPPAGPEAAPPPAEAAAPPAPPAPEAGPPAAPQLPEAPAMPAPEPMAPPAPPAGAAAPAPAAG